MKQEHPITPPPELVQQWLGEFFGCTVSGELSDSEKYLATQAARWGADQELEACCQWLADDHTPVLAQRLRAARLPKPLSLKERALEEVGVFEGMGTCNIDIIRRALEALPDD